MRRLLVPLLPLAAACGMDHHSYTSSRPDRQDLVGVYRPDEATRRQVAEHYREADTSITLGADGTVELRAIPDWCRTGSWGEPHGEFDSARGTWILRHDRGRRWVVDLDLDPPSGGERPWAGESFLRLVGESPPYSIHLHVGDPDRGHGMDFVRTAAREDRAGR